MKENLFEMYARMCRSYRDCRDGCGMHEEGVLLKLSCRTFIAEHPDKAKEIVEKWAKVHPIKTRQDVFLEMYPRASLDKDGVLYIRTCDIENRVFCYSGKDCDKCRKTIGEGWKNNGCCKVFGRSWENV